MELLLTRIAKKKTYTIGRLCILEEVIDEYSTGTAEKYFCDTLEPTWRDYEHGAYKVKGRSAIPEGRYAVVCCDGQIDENGLGEVNGNKVLVSPQSALIMHN